MYPPIKFKVCAAGPPDADMKFVRAELDRITFFHDPLVELVTDMRPGYEYNLMPSSFPPAVLWAYRNKYVVNMEPAPYSGDKQFRKGVKVQYANMILESDLLVAFVDLGGQDNDQAEDLIDLARRLGKKHKVVRY